MLNAAKGNWTLLLLLELRLLSRIHLQALPLLRLRQRSRSISPDRHRFRLPPQLK
jgi:hypothetical protein